jgi:uncharacterized protein (TIGR03437 family)
MKVKLSLVALLASLFVHAETNPSFGNLPLRFEPTQDSSEHAQFLARGNGYTLFLTERGAILKSRSATIHMKMAGGNPSPSITPQGSLPGATNYLIGNDPSKWRTGVAGFARVEYHAIYPGIDLVYYGNQRQLEYDFVVAPGADPRRIRIAFDGAENLKLDPGGDLIMRASGQRLRFRQPVLYQMVKGERRPVAGHYTLRGRQVGFTVSGYDASLPLVIDPVLSIVFATFLGGSATNDRDEGLAVDSSGSAYVMGSTASPDFPVVNPLQATYTAAGHTMITVSKFSPDGSKLIYSTFIGGSGGDSPGAIAVDAAGNAYLAGTSASTDFPLVNSILPVSASGNAFVLKLDPTGAKLVYSSQFGAGGATSLALDAAGNAYVAGATSSPTFPVVGAFQSQYGTGNEHGFISKIAPTGDHFIYSTYLGGSAIDAVKGIAVDSTGNAYVAGNTTSPDFPTKNPLQAKLLGSQSVFITELNAQGNGLIYSTFLGGSVSQNADGIAIDSSGSAYVAGSSNSTDFPTTAGAFQPFLPNINSSVDKFASAFVSKIAPLGASLAYSTFLGGSAYDSTAWAIAVDAQGSAYVTGVSNSQGEPPVADFPQANGLSPAQGGNPGPFFITKLTPNGGALAYSSYFGGGYQDFVISTGIALDTAGNAYVCGFTYNPNFPTTPNAFQPTYGARGFFVYDGFVVKFALEDTGSVNAVPALSAITPTTAIIGTPGVNVSVTGTGFLATSVVRWNGSPRTTTFVSSTQLTAALSATDLANPGTMGVSVFTPSPGGGSSNYASFVVDGTLPPQLDGISPNHLTAGGPATTVLVRGCNLGAGTVVQWNGSARTTTIAVPPSGTNFYGQNFGTCSLPTALAASITATDLATAGTVQVTVYTPPPGGGVSSPETITILPAPTIDAGGILNAASYTPTLVAGELASLFGSNFDLIGGMIYSLPLQTFDGVSVEMNGVAVPLLYVGAGQINFQVPWELQGLQTATIDVLANGVRTASQTVNLAPAAPAIFTLNAQGTGQGAILISGTTSVAGIAGVNSQPVTAGQSVSIYLTGLGPTHFQPATGSPATNATSTTPATPQVTIGGVTATVTFSGLAPNFVGLYQVNAQVPTGVPSGAQVPVIVTMDGLASNTVTIAVQ